MGTLERRTEIQALVVQRGKVRITELARRFEVSEMTIRRDLETLESQGLARRVMGGAVATVSRSYEPPFASRVAEAQGAKRAIAQAASAYVEFGETAVLDVGSSALELARVLRERAGLTVVTANIRAAVELASEPSIRVIVTGGEVRPGELSLIGAGPERTFAELNCDVMFLGVGGLHPEKGFTEYSLEDAQIKRAALAASSRCVVLADASKLDRICLATVAPIAAADVVISDAPSDHPALVAVRDAGVEVVSVTPLEV